MDLSLSVLFSNLVGLFLLIGAGFFTARRGLLPQAASGHLTTLVMKITMPATIFSSMIRPFDPAFVRDALTIVGLGFVLHLGYALISRLLIGPLRVPAGRRGMWMMCASFCNNGFMGFPVAYALFGEDGLALAVMLAVPFNLLVYSLGGKMVTLDQQEGSQAPSLSLRKAVFSVVNLTILLGLIFYILQLPVPTAIMAPIQQLANVTTPVSMFVTGMNLAKDRLTDVVRDRETVSASLTRLLLLPVLTWAFLGLLPISNPLVVGVTLIIMAMPAPAVSVVLGEQYGGCTELAARTVFLSSLLCIVTIPMIALLL